MTTAFANRIMPLKILEAMGPIIPVFRIVYCNQAGLFGCNPALRGKACNEIVLSLLLDPDGPDTVCSTEPVVSTENTAIIAGVVGGLVGVLLLSLLLVFILWYQFCRNKDLEDDSSRGSAFDFSSKRVQIINPNMTAGEQEEEIKKKDTTL